MVAPLPLDADAWLHLASHASYSDQVPAATTPGHSKAQ